MEIPDTLAVALKTDRRTRRTSVEGTIGNTMVELRARRPWASKQWGITGAVGEDDIEATLRHSRRMSRDGTIAGTWGQRRIALELKMEGRSDAAVTGHVGGIVVNVHIRQRVKGRLTAWAEPEQGAQVEISADDIVGEFGTPDEIVALLLALSGLPSETAEYAPREQIHGFRGIS